MNLTYTHLIPADFHPTSRVWVYQSNRMFNIAEALEIEKILTDFTDTWKSHGTPVKGFATLFFGQFIIVMADEEQTGVSGCSTDSSVRAIKSIENQFSVSLFERTTLAFVVKDKIELLPFNQVQYAFENGFLDDQTLFFDHSIQTKADLLSHWITPISASWLWKRMKS